MPLSRIIYLIKYLIIPINYASNELIMILLHLILHPCLNNLQNLSYGRNRKDSPKPAI